MDDAFGPPARTADRRDLSWRTAARLLIWLAVFALAGETFVRLTLTSPSRQLPDAEVGYVNMPGKTIFQSTEGFQRHRLNALGLNDGPVGPRAAGQTRLLFIGDSMLFAQQVLRANNYTSLLEGLLRIDAVNGGRDALGPQHWPALTERLAAAVRPDAVVVMISRGDLFDLLEANVRFETDAATGRTIVVRQEGGADAVQAKLAPLLQRSALLTYLGRRSATIWSSLRSGDSWLGWALGGFGRRPAQQADAAAPTDETVAQLSRIMHLLAGERPTVFILVPSLVFHGGGRAEPDLRTAIERGRFADAARATSVPYSDMTDELTEIYRRDERPFTGFANSIIGTGHLNSYGHEIVAAILARELPRLIDEAHDRSTVPSPTGKVAG